MKVLMVIPLRVTRLTSPSVSLFARGLVPPRRSATRPAARRRRSSAVGWPSVITMICLFADGLRSISRCATRRPSCRFVNGSSMFQISSGSSGSAQLARARVEADDEEAVARVAGADQLVHRDRDPLGRRPAPRPRHRTSSCRASSTVVVSVCWSVSQTSRSPGSRATRHAGVRRGRGAARCAPSRPRRGMAGSPNT